MQRLSSTVNQTTPSAVASIGLDEIYVELLIAPVAGAFELRADLVQYNAFTGRYLRDEVGSQIAEDAENAIGAADDLAWAARKALTDHDVIGGYSSPCGFGEAVEKLFAAGYAAPHAIAAE